MRHSVGAERFADESWTTLVGSVISCGFCPTVERPAAIGYVATDLSEPGTRFFAEVHGKRMCVAGATLLFITPRYKRASGARRY